MTEDQLRTIQEYQSLFMTVKLDFGTRRGRAMNEVLCFWLASGGVYRVSHISVDPWGVTVCAGNAVRLYAAWEKGDRFVHMYDALAWEKLVGETYSRQLKWDDYSTWEMSIGSTTENVQSRVLGEDCDNEFNQKIQMFSGYVFDVYKQIGPCPIDVLTQQMAFVCNVPVTDDFSYLVQHAFNLLQQSGKC